MKHKLVYTGAWVHICTLQHANAKNQHNMKTNMHAPWCMYIYV